MAITFKLYTTSSPKEKIVKALDGETSFDCVLKDDTSILNPVLILESATALTGFNYMHCPDLSRYYFITNIESIGNNLWRISAHVDVLMTYASKILQNTAVIKRQQGIYNLYLDDPYFHVYNYERIQTLKFPNNTFLKSLQYVLVTNGYSQGSSNLSEVKNEEVIENGNQL